MADDQDSDPPTVDAAGQLQLWDSGQLDGVLGQLERSGEYTGERLKARDPERYAGCVRLLAEGVGMLRIARILGLSHHTVAAVRDRAGVEIDQDKRRLSAELRTFARMGAERLVDEVMDLDRDKLPVAVAVAIDKIQVLDGQPSSILGHADASGVDQDRERFDAWIRNLPSADQLEDQGNRPPAVVEISAEHINPDPSDEIPDQGACAVAIPKTREDLAGNNQLGDQASDQPVSARGEPDKGEVGDQANGADPTAGDQREDLAGETSR